MKKAFNVCAALMVALLIANQAVVRVQAGERTSMKTSLSCAQGADRVRAIAVEKGFSAAGSGSQAEVFLSNCLITGGGRVGDSYARN